ncbi:MAG: pyrophosphohydrolase related protein [uncultured bacterium]|nr:MAG: pyrophosphohydrolase related protein [uncultured bacterium]
MKINGPWKIKESREIYKNFWTKFREDKVIGPDGKDRSIAILEARNGVSVLPIDEYGYVYLEDQFRYVIERRSIETGGGAINDNESALDAAKRELREELGIEADEWVDLGIVNPFTSIVKSSQQMFLARNLRFGKDDQDSAENITLIKVKLEEAVEMVINGAITHAPSCVLILKANGYLKLKLL